MEKFKVCSDENEILVKIDDFDKDDDLLLLSKEIEKAKFEDTIDLSKYLDDTIIINKSILNLK